MKELLFRSMFGAVTLLARKERQLAPEAKPAPTFGNSGPPASAARGDYAVGVPKAIFVEVLAMGVDLRRPDAALAQLFFNDGDSLLFQTGAVNGDSVQEIMGIRASDIEANAVRVKSHVAGFHVQGGETADFGNFRQRPGVSITMGFYLTALSLQF